MSAWFYASWYSGAAVFTLLVWAWTRRLGSPRARLAVRVAAVALGFTTVPLFGQGGGVWFPMAFYYLTTGPARFEAWGKATVLIGAVWLVIFMGALLIGAVWSFIRRQRAE